MSSYLFSLPAPEGKSFAQLRASDSAEILAVNSEADGIAAKISGQSLQELTKSVIKVPGDKGIRAAGNDTLKGLRAEFDRAMKLTGVEAKIRALAVAKVAERLGIELEDIVSPHREDRHHRALEDARRFERAAFVLPTKKTIGNPFANQRRRSRNVGTYQSGNKAVVASLGAHKIFQNKRNKRLWK